MLFSLSIKTSIVKDSNKTYRFLKFKLMKENKNKMWKSRKKIFQI